MKPIAISLGDPAGIGSEVVLGALGSLPSGPSVCLFGEWRFTEPVIPTALRDRLRLVDEPPAGDVDQGTIHFVDTKLSSATSLRWGEVDALHGSIALQSIDAAVTAVERGLCSSIVTAPIHKQAIALAGSKVPGHTEILAARCGLARYGVDYAMYFDSPSLRVSLLSVHVPLRTAIEMIEPDRIASLCKLSRDSFVKLYGYEPRIAVAGLNPHAGEGGMFGDEETLVAAGIELARTAGIDASGPYPPDTVFNAAIRGKHDLVIALYHDQGLIPMKTVAFDTSVNVTIGLPWLRCSVDHGTAFDIAGKGIANWRPMAFAIEWAARFAPRWSES